MTRRASQLYAAHVSRGCKHGKRECSTCAAERQTIDLERLRRSIEILKEAKGEAK